MPPKKNKITKKATNGSIKKKNNDGKTPVKKKQQKDKEFVQVPNANENDIDISDEDLAFFEENQDFGNFLQSMNSKELARKVTKAKAPKKANISKEEKLESVPEPMELSSSEDEDYDDDEMITQDTNELIDSEDEGEFLRDLSSDSESEVQQQQQQLSTKRKNKKDLSKKNESDDEMDYEMKPRKVANEWSKKDYVNKLPIKLASGKIAEQEHIEEEEESDVESIDEEQEEYEKMNQKGDNDSESSKFAYSEDESTMDESKLTKKQLIILKKEELASLATSIQEDPEENIGRLKGFRDMYKTDNATVRKLALLAQLAVYKDIIPGYRIRLSTEKEESVLVSKDIRKLRQYEKTLLHNYEAYLKDLNALLSKRNTEIDKSMAIVATKCLCELLTSKPHFNFRLEIMVSIVARMSTYKWDEMAELSYNAIINILEGDESGRISLDAVIMITRMIKSKHYTVNEKVVTLFLHLRLKDEMAPISNSNNKEDNPLQRKRKAKDKPFLNKKAKKALKETKEIEKEFQEAEAIVSKEEKDKHHTETLKLLFAFYFRVLKQYTTSPLLPNVLEGLARFSHLINVDFFNDLLNALRNVMQQLNNTTNDFTAYATTNTRKCLLCIITAFQLLSGQGEAVNYDLKDFYKEIYQILLQATFHTRLEDDWVLSTNNNNNSNEQQTITVSSESESELILRGLEMMFLRKRQIPIDRLAAFVKRFSLVALNMPTKTVSNCLNLVQRLINKDHRLDALIQSEDRASTGLYMPLLQDPELSNPFGTSLYELFLYQNHYDPTIRALAQTLQQQPSTN
ncbi:nucleolar complex-associated protein-domain-containing protein [Cunninghamella echinulata]|nr:nucleolar complex-associated protein-domain-containing protein [Cunninghamella echinulata]